MRRKSYIEINRIYFWTCTIHHWNRLLVSDEHKELIKNNLLKLVKEKLATIYGYVIMPNHLHLIVKFNQLNGKEKPSASFLKATSHLLLNKLKDSNDEDLRNYAVEEHDRNYRIWQRDSLAVELNSKEMMEQKLAYIHNNPIHERWKLVENKNDYLYSSSTYYHQEISKNAELITDYRTVF